MSKSDDDQFKNVMGHLIEAITSTTEGKAAEGTLTRAQRTQLDKIRNDHDDRPRKGKLR